MVNRLQQELEMQIYNQFPLCSKLNKYCFASKYLLLTNELKGCTFGIEKSNDIFGLKDYKN
jgi:hypothetical protein